jgi:hypothetical protein
MRTLLVESWRLQSHVSKPEPSSLVLIVSGGFDCLRLNHQEGM